MPISNPRPLPHDLSGFQGPLPEIKLKLKPSSASKRLPVALLAGLLAVSPVFADDLCEDMDKDRAQVLRQVQDKIEEEFDELQAGRDTMVDCAMAISEVAGPMVANTGMLDTASNMLVKRVTKEVCDTLRRQADKAVRDVNRAIDDVQNSIGNGLGKKINEAVENAVGENVTNAINDVSEHIKRENTAAPKPAPAPARQTPQPQQPQFAPTIPQVNSSSSQDSLNDAMRRMMGQ